MNRMSPILAEFSSIQETESATKYQDRFLAFQPSKHMPESDQMHNMLEDQQHQLCNTVLLCFVLQKYHPSWLEASRRVVAARPHYPAPGL